MQSVAAINKGFRALRVQAAAPYLISAADNEPERNTYRAFLYGLASAAAITDLLTLRGAANKTIRLKALTLSGSASAATNVGVYLAKRTAAPTGGTPTTVTPGAADSTDPNPAATLQHYASGAPTPGAGAVFDGGRLNLAPAANGSIDRLVFQYTWQNDKAPLLVSASEWFALNFNNANISGVAGAVDIGIAWTEE